MSYYIISDIEDIEFARLQGPYTNKNQVIAALELISNAGVFNSKREAKEYLEEWFVNVATKTYRRIVDPLLTDIANIVLKQ